MPLSEEIINQIREESFAIANNSHHLFPATYAAMEYSATKGATLWAERYQELREVLKDFAKQKTTHEMTAQEIEDGDFDYAYNYFINKSRQMLPSGGGEKEEGNE